MGRLKRTWLFVSGAVACAITLALPYRPRLLFAKVLSYLTNPRLWTASAAYQKQLRFWNRMVLGLVFFLGFPIAALLFRLGGRGRLAPRSGSATYWVPRRPPTEMEQGIRDPF